MNVIYDKEQQLFSLCTLASIVSMKRASHEALVEMAQTGMIQVLNHPDVINYIGKWDLVWGPAVWVHNDGKNKQVADNVMFVAKQAGETVDRYVVAIAGTNPISWYSWVNQNFKVCKTVEWPYLPNDSDPKDRPKIAEGTQNGLDVLLNEMTDPESSTSLVNFLTEELKNPDKPCELIVTGFSLGGALSQVLALALDHLLPLASDQVTFLPFSVGGPSPGDEAFARYYNAQLGADASRLWNAKDIVPHAWQKDLLKQATDVYMPDLKPSPPVKGLFWLAIQKTKKNHYQHTSGKVLPAGNALKSGQLEDTQALLSFHESQDQESFQELLAKGLEAAQEQDSTLMGSSNQLPPNELASILTQLLPSYLNPELQAPALLSSMLEQIEEEEMQELLEGTSQMATFLREAFHQHMYAYRYLFHIEGFVEIYEQVKGELREKVIPSTL